MSSKLEQTNILLKEISNSLRTQKHALKKDEFKDRLSQLGFEVREKPIKLEEKSESSLRKEKNTLLKMVIGMAIDAYGYDPSASRSPIPKELEAIFDLQGLSVSDDTIRKKLKEAAKLIPEDTKSGQ